MEIDLRRERERDTLSICFRLLLLAGRYRTDYTAPRARYEAKSVS